MKSTRARAKGLARPRIRLTFETLEDRAVPAANPALGSSATELMYPNYAILNAGSPQGGARLYGYGDPVAPAGQSAPPSSAFTPDQIKKAYGIDQISFGGITGDGTGQTVAIVDAFDNPTIAASLIKFSTTLGLPVANFTKVNQTGGSTPPSADSGWAYEIALDVEWVHAIAPKASILLVEADSNANSNLEAAVNYAKSVPGVTAISMSYGGGEFSTEATHDSIYTSLPGHPVTFLASSGDDAAIVESPSVSPNVLAVGGTSLYTDVSDNYSSETAWDNGDGGTGGGISLYEARPSYQVGAGTPSVNFRTVPDVAFDADPETGVPVCEEYNGGTTNCWYQFGGTSFSCPSMAALIAIANQGRAKLGKSALDGRADTLTKIYAAPASTFHDVTDDPGFGVDTGPGYDTSTGRGTPIAQAFLAALVGADVTGGPVTFVNAKTATYTEPDGDMVKVAFSKPILTDANISTVFTTIASGTGVQVQKISLAGLAAAGTNITITVKRAGVSDGRANIGLIDATGFDIGAVSIAGDLGKILAGDATASTAGINSLSVSSLGEFGTDSQAAGGDLSSSVVGSVNNLTVKTGIGRGVSFAVSGSVKKLSVGGTQGGFIKVTGDLRMGTISGDLPGVVEVDGNAGKLKVGGSILGAFNLGQLVVKGNATSIGVGGSVIGGHASFAGSVEVDGSLGSITVGRDIDGGAATANGQNISWSGSINVQKHLGKVMVGGSINGGVKNGFTGVNLLGAGAIDSNADIGSVTIKGNLTGGDTPALISALEQTAPAGKTLKTDLAIGSVTVKGNVQDAEILAGFDWNELPANGSAQIGMVSVGGDWVRSDLLAGVDLTGAAIGPSSNPLATSEIGGFKVGGQVLGSSSGTTTYFIAADYIKSAKIAGGTLALTKGDSNDNLILGFYSNMNLLEV